MNHFNSGGHDGAKKGNATVVIDMLRNYNQFFGMRDNGELFCRDEKIQARWGHGKPDSREDFLPHLPHIDVWKKHPTNGRTPIAKPGQNVFIQSLSAGIPSYNSSYYSD